MKGVGGGVGEQIRLETFRNIRYVEAPGFSKKSVGDFNSSKTVSLQLLSCQFSKVSRDTVSNAVSVNRISEHSK